MMLKKRFVSFLLSLALISMMLPLGMMEKAQAAGGVNLITDPGFEDGKTAGWSVMGGAAISAVQWDYRQGGAWSAKVTGRTQSWAGPVYNLTSKVTNGNKYRFSFWVRHDGAATEAFSLVVKQVVNGVTSFTKLADLKALPKGQYARLDGIYNLSYSGTLNELSVYIESSNATLSYYMDNCFVSKINTTPVFSKAKVVGNKLVNANGAVVNYKGMNVWDPVGTEEIWDPDYYVKAASWGAKVVRLPIHPRDWLQRGTQERWDMLDQAIQWSQDSGMQVIIDWHAIGALWTGFFEDNRYVHTQQDFNDFWTGAANRYKNDSRILFYELFNEPLHSSTGWIVTEQDWINQRNWAQNGVNLIRAIDPSTPIGVAGLSWAGNLKYVGAHPINASSIIYIVHPYPNTGNQTSWQTDWGYLSANYPVYATELGFDNDPNHNNGIYNESRFTNNGGTGRYREAIDTFLKDRGIQWTVWSFSYWGPALLTDATSYTPTEAGTYYKDLLSGVTPAAKLSGTAFGTSPAYAAGSEFGKAFDGSTGTFFDYAYADGGYTGLDLGSQKSLTKVRYYPRSGLAGRMIGGKFQGSNTSGTSGFVDLATISSAPDSTWTELTLSGSYRYVRYLSPNGSYGNVAEIEIYGR